MHLECSLIVKKIKLWLHSTEKQEFAANNLKILPSPGQNHYCLEKYGKLEGVDFEANLAALHLADKFSLAVQRLRGAMTCRKNSEGDVQQLPHSTMEAQQRLPCLATIRRPA